MEKEKTLIVALDLGGNRRFEAHVRELTELAKACDLSVCECIIQHADRANAATYIGSGKAEEVLYAVRQYDADLVIFDGELSPMQLKNLKNILDIPVMDRNTLILEIFSRRARTKESKLQVEIASLKYALPRLVGLHDALSRQGGASGAMSNKGAGEKKLELDRRHIENRIAFLRKELENVAKTRVTQRSLRKKSGLPLVGLVGYTNAGKSSIMNGMLSLYGRSEEKMVFEKDMLFATLETGVREISTEKGKTFLLSDTVGFVDDLPHDLVQAFHSTLEEVCESSLLIHVIDITEEYLQEHMDVTTRTVKSLGAGDIPMLTVFNKTDLAGTTGYPKRTGDVLYISAKQPESIAFLAAAICEKLFAGRKKCELFIPYDKGSILSAITTSCEVLSTEYEAEGIRAVAYLDEKHAGRYLAYIQNIE